MRASTRLPVYSRAKTTITDKFNKWRDFIFSSTASGCVMKPGHRGRCLTPIKKGRNVVSDRAAMTDFARLPPPPVKIDGSGEGPLPLPPSTTTRPEGSYDERVAEVWAPPGSSPHRHGANTEQPDSMAGRFSTCQCASPVTLVQAAGMARISAPAGQLAKTAAGNAGRNRSKRTIAAPRPGRATASLPGRRCDSRTGVPSGMSMSKRCILS